MGKSQRQRHARQRANAAKRERAGRREDDAITSGPAPSYGGPDVVRPFDWSDDDQSGRTIRMQEPFGSGDPVRPGTRLGVHGVLRRLVLGTADTAATNLLLDVARLRAGVRTLVHDLDRTLRRPVIKDHELDRLRHRVNRVAVSVARIHRRNRDGWCLAAVGHHATSLAVNLSALREPGPYSVRVRDSRLIATKAEVKALLDVFAISVETITVDVSGADLSSLDPAALDRLRNVIWTDRTSWPPEMAKQVRDQSVRLAPGVFRVVGTTD